MLDKGWQIFLLGRYAIHYSPFLFICKPMKLSINQNPLGGRNVSRTTVIGKLYTCIQPAPCGLDFQPSPSQLRFVKEYVKYDVPLVLAKMNGAQFIKVLITLHTWSCQIVYGIDLLKH